MKFIKPFRGAKAGEIYPTNFAIGDECPAELESAAQSEKVLGTDKETEKAKAEADAREKALADARAQAKDEA